MIEIYDDKNKAQKRADDIHVWLLKYREGYKADKWCDVEQRKSDGGEFYVKVPPDFEKLNEKITEKDKLKVSKDAIKQLDKLPDNWRTNTWDG
jgi:hypothetical protein